VAQANNDKNAPTMSRIRRLGERVADGTIKTGFFLVFEGLHGALEGMVDNRGVECNSIFNFWVRWRRAVMF
jgi:hypothetical protein